MTGIFINLCAVILSTYVSNSFAAEWRRAKNLDSPNFPDTYDNNIDVIWQVVAPVGYRVRIRFTDFSTEEDIDVVAVHEGWTLENSRSTWRAYLSGWSILANLTSQGSYLQDKEAPNQHMNLLKANMTGISSTFGRYSVNLSINLQAGGQELIQSPNYPSNYNNNADVVWKVTAPKSYRITLHFIEFSTQGNDIVRVYEGWTSRYLRSTQKASLSGASVPAGIVSRGSYLWVRFTSNIWYTEKGFKARLSAELRTIILNTEGAKNLDSPNFPDTYDNNIDVIWQVVAPVGYRVRIRFTDFSTEEDIDVVAVHEGWTLENSRMVGITFTVSFGQSWRFKYLQGGAVYREYDKGSMTDMKTFSGT
eukprot:XP_011682575.1 PREDICTED: CUB and sushi domain-containing protein 2-like [Strongylocentrotus purpuratus]